MKLSAEKIKKCFPRGDGSFDAVKETDLTLEGGKLYIVSGRSGSGKTTLMNMLCGILPPDSGSVTFDGTDLYRMNDRQLSRFRNETFGIIPQGQSAVATLTVLENVLLPATIYQRGDDLTKKAEELLEKMKISDLRDVLPAELSGGEMRRMAIARSLICDPKVLFADEPTSDLDDENTKTVFEVLKQIAQSGCAVFAVSHEKCASMYADEMRHMDAGVLSGNAGTPRPNKERGTVQI